MNYIEWPILNDFCELNCFRFCVELNRNESNIKFTIWNNYTKLKWNCSTSLLPINDKDKEILQEIIISSLKREGRKLFNMNIPPKITVDEENLYKYSRIASEMRNLPISKLGIRKVIFNDPATIVYWIDGSKTVVKCQEGDTYDKEKGLAMAISKKVLGNKGNFNNIFKHYCEEEN